MYKPKYSASYLRNNAISNLHSPSIEEIMEIIDTKAKEASDLGHFQCSLYFEEEPDDEIRNLIRKIYNKVGFAIDWWSNKRMTITF